MKQKRNWKTTNLERKKRSSFLGLVCRTITEDTVETESFSLIGNDEGLKQVINYDKDMIIEPDPLDPKVHNENKILFELISKASGLEKQISL